MSVVDELLIYPSVWEPSKYGEASAKAIMTSHMPI